MPFTQQDILFYLDQFDQETYHFFIDLEHPYFHTAGSRLTLYADETRWAIVFEKSGYSNAGVRGEIDLTYFGNCLVNLQSEGSQEGFTSNSKSVILIDGDEIHRIENDSNELVAPAVTHVKVRDVLLKIEHDKQVYKERDINDVGFDENEPLVDIPSLIRYLDEEHTDLFRATKEELVLCLPKGLPCIMQIDQWHHAAYYQGDGEKPSEQETYQLIAEVLVSKDITKWKPVLSPNNDWRNWRNAGYM